MPIVVPFQHFFQFDSGLCLVLQEESKAFKSTKAKHWANLFASYLLLHAVPHRRLGLARSPSAAGHPCSRFTDSWKTGTTEDASVKSRNCPVKLDGSLDCLYSSCVVQTPSIQATLLHVPQKSIAAAFASSAGEICMEPNGRVKCCMLLPKVQYPAVSINCKDR